MTVRLQDREVFLLLFSYFFQKVFFCPQLTLRQLIQPNLTMNLGLLLGVSQVPLFGQAALLVLDYRWLLKPRNYRSTVSHNWHRTHIVLKFGLQNSWTTGACHYTQNSSGNSFNFQNFEFNFIKVQEFSHSPINIYAIL